VHTALLLFVDVCITNFSAFLALSSALKLCSNLRVRLSSTISPRRPPNVFYFLLVLQYYLVHACLLWLPHLMAPWLLRYCNGNRYFPSLSPNQLVETASCTFPVHPSLLSCRCPSYRRPGSRKGVLLHGVARRLLLERAFRHGSWNAKMSS
jgi:hypothetical protein